MTNDDDDYRPPRAPNGLQGPGRKLWKTVLSGFQMRGDELLLLAAAAKLADETARLEAELSTSPTMVVGSTGQAKVSPLFGEIRAHRLAFGRILAGLGLADALDPDGSARSTAGRRMARARWSGR
jgi:hypothetical protein